MMLLSREIEFQKIEVETLTAELILARQEYVTQNIEKHKRAEELIIANKELEFQNMEKQKRAIELLTANKELKIQNKENKKLTAKLTVTYNELKQTEEYLRSYIKGIGEMLFMTSHRMRQPISHILGVSTLLSEESKCTMDELKMIVGYIKKSATALDEFTRELTEFMSRMGK